MTIDRADGGLTLESVLLDEIPRDEPLPVVAASRGQNLVARCSVCNHYGVGARWVDIVDSVTAKKLLSDDRPVGAIHGVCPSCTQRLRAPDR